MISRNFIRFLIPAATVAILTACSTHPDITGTWVGTPSRVDNITAAASASATTSLTFSPSADGKNDHGQIFISSLIDASQPVSQTTPSIDEAHEVSVAATAVISGSWTFEDHDDDDIILSLDPASLQVNVDPNGVTFSNNILTQTQQPQLDSLTNATAGMWKKSITDAMKQHFYKLQKITDIKIRNGIMSCEIEDRDFTFRKSGE